MRKEETVVWELWRFLKRFWWVGVLSIPMLVVVTFFHESAHAVAAWAQGGTLLEFVIWPSGDKWGYVRYRFPHGVSYSSFAISIAPYVWWFGVSVLAVLLSLRHRAYAPWVAGPLFAWLFVFPLGDIANAAFPYLTRSRSNDWYNAFGAPSASWWPWGLTALTMLYAVVVGYLIQRRFFRDLSLSLSAYTVLSGVLVAGLLMV